MTTRRSLLVNGVLALVGATTAAASIPLDAMPSDGPDCVDAQAVRGHPGFVEGMHRYHWSVYLDGRLLTMDGSGGFYVKGADQRAGFVDVYLCDRAGHIGSGDITRRYGRVRIYQGERV